MGLVAAYQLADFLTPTNTTVDDADQVRGNDNTIRAAFNNHDGDTGIHFQGSTLAARPVAGRAGRTWLTGDERRIYYDDGANWQEIAYGRLASPTFTGTMTTPNLTVTGSAVNSLTLAGTASITLDGPSGGLVAVSAADYLQFFNATGGTFIQLRAVRPAIAPPGTLGAIAISAGSLTTPGDINVSPGAGKQVTLGPTGSAQLEVKSDGKVYYAGTVLFNSVRPVWSSPTGTVARATFDTATVTLAELAQRVAFLIIDLRATHGLLG